jgi:hypothetical protein
MKQVVMVEVHGADLEKLLEFTANAEHLKALSKVTGAMAGAVLSDKGVSLTFQEAGLLMMYSRLAQKVVQAMTERKT